MCWLEWGFVDVGWYFQPKKNWMTVEQMQMGSELTKLPYISALEVDWTKALNIPRQKLVTTLKGEDVVEGKKKSKKSWGGTGPTKKGNISIDSCWKVASIFRNQSVVALWVCTGVPDSSTEEVRGIVGGVMGCIWVLGKRQLASSSQLESYLASSIEVGGSTQLHPIQLSSASARAIYGN